MHLALRTGFSLVALTLLLPACQRDNPQFNSDVGQSETGTDATTTDSTSTSQSTTVVTDTMTGDSGPGDGDGDGDGDGAPGDGDGAPGDGDGGPIDTGMEAPNLLDMGAPACMVPTNQPLNPRFGSPAQMDGGVCAPEIGTWIHPVAVNNGNLMVYPCTQGCYTCDVNVQMEMGAPGLAIKDAFPAPGPYSPNAPAMGCYYVEAENLIGEEASGCYYSAISVHGEGPAGALKFHANRDSWGLTYSAGIALGNWHPQLADQDAPQCDCGQVDIDCCPGQTVVAKQFQIGNNMFVVPVGSAPLSLMANGQIVPFTFFGAQAQGGTNCEIDPETSWALYVTP